MAMTSHLHMMPRIRKHRNSSAPLVLAKDDGSSAVGGREGFIAGCTLYQKELGNIGVVTVRKREYKQTIMLEVGRKC